MILYSRGQIAEAMAQWRAGLSTDPDYQSIPGSNDMGPGHVS
jgi:hypothetical protein